MEGYKIEKWVIIILWTGMLVSFPIAFFGERGLYLSDIIGFISLAMVSLIFYFKKSAGLFALLILLFIGTTNVATFIAFWSYRISFNSVGQQLAPGIQLYSLIFFAALAVLRRPTIFGRFSERFWSFRKRPDDRVRWKDFVLQKAV